MNEPHEQHAGPFHRIQYNRSLSCVAIPLGQSYEELSPIQHERVTDV